MELEVGGVSMVVDRDLLIGGCTKSMSLIGGTSVATKAS